MRSGFAVRGAAGLACLCLLAACGVRVVKEQATASFVDTGQKAVASTRQFYQDLVNANNAYNSFRWAVDAQCPLLAPGERLSAPGLDDPSALPLAIERLPKLPRACAAYVAQACHRRAGGSLDCHPAAGTVSANGFFCPSEAAQACAPALAAADWKRVSRYSDNPLNAQASYVSLAAGDFSADSDSIRILTRYLDSLSAVAHGGGQDLAADLGHEADALQALTQQLRPASARKTTSAAASASTATSGKDDLATPLLSLASGIRSSVNQGGSADAIAKVLRQPALQQQVSDAIEQLARAVDGKFCSMQPADALRSASDIGMYLGFGYGPNDLAARETLVKQAVGYKSLVASSLAACSTAQQANAADPQGSYHPASPAATLLMGVKRANDILVKEIVHGELSDAQRKQAWEISFQEFEAAVEKAASLVSSLQAL